MFLQSIENGAFYLNLKLFSQNFIGWFIESDEKIKILT